MEAVFRICGFVHNAPLPETVETGRRQVAIQQPRAIECVALYCHYGDGVGSRFGGRPFDRLSWPALSRISRKAANSQKPPHSSPGAAVFYKLASTTLAFGPTADARSDACGLEAGLRRPSRRRRTPRSRRESTRQSRRRQRREALQSRL